jgi:serine/threonine-protein kinase RsbW/stage II sporulation protein AB (anti-sigma F factor)
MDFGGASRRVSDIRNGWHLVPRGSLSGVPSASWTVSARPDTVAFLRQIVADFVIANGIAEPHVTDIRLAVSEAASNAIMHAFRDRSERGTVSVGVTVDDGEIEIVVRDDGSGMAPRDDSPGLGLGLPLIRRVADGFDHRVPRDGGTELWMRFLLPCRV